ncbi:MULTISPECIES: hypothetical protein [unclassified Lentimonas]|uniref:hypothetical protein n=1 Tax=unclassified Lentimonas TaxID=2630993 RepID=UPI001389D3B9|nr:MULTISPECIES: hypothetical protein [unclassified Lentimonas]
MSPFLEVDFDDVLRSIPEPLSGSASWRFNGSVLGEGRPPRLPRSTLPSRRASALNQSTSTPQDEAELVPPVWVELKNHNS